MAPMWNLEHALKLQQLKEEVANSATHAVGLGLSLAGAALAVVLAYVWLAWFNGYGIAAVFLAGVDPAPSFPVPFELAPVPALMAFTVSLLIVQSGTLFSSWRAAVVSPVEALR